MARQLPRLAAVGIYDPDVATLRVRAVHDAAISRPVDAAGTRETVGPVIGRARALSPSGATHRPTRISSRTATSVRPPAVAVTV